jgi:hypothetical protein
VIGQTGTSKSTLLLNLIRQDLAAGEGLALLDPHGDLAEAALVHSTARVGFAVPPELANFRQRTVFGRETATLKNGCAALDHILLLEGYCFAAWGFWGRGDVSRKGRYLDGHGSRQQVDRCQCINSIFSTSRSLAAADHLNARPFTSTYCVRVYETCANDFRSDGTVFHSEASSVSL